MSYFSDGERRKEPWKHKCRKDFAKVISRRLSRHFPYFFVSLLALLAVSLNPTAPLVIFCLTGIVLSAPSPLLTAPNKLRQAPLGFFLSRPSSIAIPHLDLVSLALSLVQARPILLAYCLSRPNSLPAFCSPFFSRLIFSVSSFTSPEFLDLSYPW